MFRIVFEKILALSRLFVLLPVVFGIVSAAILFVAASYDLVHMVTKMVNATLRTSEASLHAYMVSEIIGAVDLYLIAIVLLIFSFGLYELFISEIQNGEHKINLP